MKKFTLHAARFFVAVGLLVLNTTLWAQDKTAPILILHSGAQKNEYTGEMLRAEGFHSFDYLDVHSDVFSLKTLSSADLVIVPRIDLSAAAVSTLLAFIQSGGNVIVFRPQTSLATALGLSRKGNPVENGYLSIIDNKVIGEGLLTQSLQWHGGAELFQADVNSHSTMLVIAGMLDAQKNDLHCPAVAYFRKGKGQVVVFMYDLSRSTMLSRQGNYQLAGLETDGINGVRAMDMFTGGWVDTANNTLNQADEQLRLLSSCVESLVANRKPQPRCWYFPDTLKALIALTNDGEFRSAADFSQQFSDVSAHHARMTLYDLSPDKIDSAFTDSSVRNGFEIAAHPDATAEAGNPTWNGVNQAIRIKMSAMLRFPGVVPIRTNTNHWFVWCGKDSTGTPDFSAGAKIESLNGIRMDVNYAHYDNHATVKRFLGPTGYRQGNYTGSGLPMKFGSIDGKTINVYQLFNNVYDQEYMENSDPNGYEAAFRGLLDRSIHDDIFSYICIRAHNDEYYFSKAPLMRMLDYASQNGIPVWPVNRVLDFLTARDSVSFDQMKWKNGEFSFRLNSKAVGKDRPTVILPMKFNNTTLTTIKEDGTTVPFSTRVIKGKPYALFFFESSRIISVLAEYR